MKKALFTGLFLFLTTTSFAILPPFYHSKAEIQKILSDPRLEERLGSGELIKKISRNEDGYLIETTKYTLQIDINYIHQELIGPAKFELAFHEKEPLEN
jgi:hypothetical protein